MKTHAIIFMHGLGDTPSGWSFLTRALPSYPNRDLAFVYPPAPTSPVTCNGGMMMTSWFDIINIPVTSSEPDTPAGYLDSVSKIHSIIDSVKSQHNLPSTSIILGGFSQGGAMSLLAASSYPESLGGCICLSGWGLSKSTSFPAWSTTHSKVPIFIGHGLSDNVVLPSLGQSCASEIEKGREGKEGGKVTFKTYQGEGHGACEEELKDLALWIDEVTK